MALSNPSRFLITSADERCWNLNQPVLFLGDWCLHYNRRHVLKDLDAVIMQPYSPSKVVRRQEVESLRTIESDLFKAMVEVLNRYHRLQRSHRYWKIIVGHWLQHFTHVVFNRFQSLRYTAELHDISSGAYLSIPDFSLATADSAEFIHACNDDVWNDQLLTKIRLFTGVPAANFTQIDICHPQRGRSSAKPRSNLVVNTIKHAIGFASTLASRGSKVFIIDSYLPRSEELKLHLSLGQAPQYWGGARKKPKICADMATRRSLAAEMGGSFENGMLSNLMASLVWELLPISYLEGFAHEAEFAKHRGWPRKPDTIFTSSNYAADDTFKIWTASKAEAGVKYVIGQHGNNPGTHRQFTSPIEIDVCDKYLTWGWAHQQQKCLPSFLLKLPKSEMLRNNKRGGLLLVEYAPPRRVSAYDEYHKFKHYFREQIDFVSSLTAEPRSSLTIRLHGDSLKMHENEVSRWAEFDPAARVVVGTESFKRSISESRLVVFSYDSTGMLELLNQNIPVIGFWQNGFDHLRDEVIEDYEALLDAGIIHLDPAQAALKVNEVFDNIDLWWRTELVQSARRKFCDKYARHMDDAIPFLKTALKSN